MPDIEMFFLEILLHDLSFFPRKDKEKNGLVDVKMALVVQMLRKNKSRNLIFSKLRLVL